MRNCMGSEDLRRRECRDHSMRIKTDKMHTAGRILIIAGPNGAGKSTFAREYLPKEAGCPVFVNADLIAAGLSPFEPESAAIRAGRLMLEEIDRYAASGTSFAFETTLSGRTYARRIIRWRADGFRVELIFLTLPTAEAAIARVAARVRQGGHNIAENVIRRRFVAGLQNFQNLYKPLVDSWALYNNSGPAPVMLDAGENS
jgi:predicted ABC-type ATPase